MASHDSGRAIARRLGAATVVFCLLAAAEPVVAPIFPPRVAAQARAVRERALADDTAYETLRSLTTEVGPRLAGSEGDARAVAWALARLRALGFRNVRAEPVWVPRWIRGEARAEIVSPWPQRLVAAALGGSVGTPPGGIEADVLVVGSFDELSARSAAARGRIVLFDVPFTTYSDTVPYRTGGARVAAQHGAVAVLVRAVGPMGLRTPHTGSVQYVPGQPAIPAAVVAAEDAGRIARLTARGLRVRLRLTMDARDEGLVESANVIGEIRGRERPDEIVLVGCHLDSWDVGTGASDDGVGCIVTWEGLRLMRALGIRPRRTVRLVLWTNEENGFGGANAYAAKYAAGPERHVFALESDSGVFSPASLGFSGSTAARALVAQATTLLAPLGISGVGPSGGGADIAPIAEAVGMPTMAYLGDASTYFMIHHTAADTVERIPPEDVSKAVAAVAVMTYVMAEMPQPLPR
jgi:carboxypeptidase Q